MRWTNKTHDTACDLHWSVALQDEYNRPLEHKAKILLLCILLIRMFV
jgi:hypothetical protein